MIKSFRGKYRFLSNFCYCLIRSRGHNWRTVEHLFQAMKTTNVAIQQKIRKTQYPADAKMFGSMVSLRPDWEDVKLLMMKQILRMKFDQSSKLRERLLDTGKEKLVEGNQWHDNFWGDCTCPKCKNIIGLNWLGKLLMEVREELQK